MSENRQPNRLIDEASPYLQQHAHNPVDWYPWSNEALTKAVTENKPIFLSIGYSACHWCHVMEEESFANDEIARLMNEHFVSIKVDREERPDLDQLYQTACQIATGSGGWPLSVFLLPDQRPFFVGTYFPPVNRYGRPGFRQVLSAIGKAWVEKRQDFEASAERLTAAIGQASGLPEPVEQPETPLAAAVEWLKRHFDKENGGFGGAPKFPQPALLQLLLRHHHNTGDGASLDLVTFTLEKMRRGGLYDQLAGGFHRYSVDKQWQVPHFEKMLYDNAALPPVYLAAYQLTGDERFAETVRGTLDYVLQEMTAPTGGFYATQDADTEGEEGRYFVWRPAQLAAVLGAEKGRLLAEHLGVTDKGNFEGGTTVLALTKTAEELGVSQAELDKAKAELLAAREQRVKPFRDEKIITGWNGLMISAMAQAGRVLGEVKYVEAAGRAADFVLANLVEEGELRRHHKRGKAHGVGYLEDYANLTAGLIDLYEATFDQTYLEQALALARKTLELFWDGGGAFHTTPSHGEGLIHRPYDYYDDATPSGTAVAVNNLLRLQVHTEDAAFREVPAQVFDSLGRVLQSAQGGAALILAYDLAANGPTEVTLAESTWAARLNAHYLPRLVLKEGSVNTVCKNYACSPPLHSYEDLEARL